MNVITSAVSLRVMDPAASSRFFTTHLGYREVLRGEELIILCREDTGLDIVLLQRSLEQPPSEGLVDVMVTLTVTDVAAEYRRLRAEGVHISVPLRREPWGEYQLQLTDPNGVVVQLLEWIPPAGD